MVIIFKQKETYFNNFGPFKFRLKFQNLKLKSIALKNIEPLLIKGHSSILYLKLTHSL